MVKQDIEIPTGTRTLIVSKLYYGILSKKLEKAEIERYFSILYFIRNNNGCCCQQDICDTLYIDKTAMVKVLDTLSKAGMIERKTNPKDRRQYYISLSKKGQAKTKELSKTFSEIEEELFRNVSVKDRETFITVLDQLTGNLESVPKNDLFFNYKKTRKE